MTDDRTDALLIQAQALDNARTHWDSLWQELADVVHPRRGTIQNKSETPDRTKLADMFDGTAMRANGILANGQASRITPMGARWMVLRPPSQLATQPKAISWYQRCSEIMAVKLGSSNFYAKAQEHYLDRGAFGVAATEVTASKDGQGLHFRAFPVGSYSIAENSMGEVDTIARTYEWTAKQIREAFPDTTPADILKAAEDPSHTAKYKILHFVFPRTDRNPLKTDAKNKPFASFHILKAEKHILLESGFDEMPVAVSRWATWGDSPYGWAPSYAALPEATQANTIEQMLDVATETAVFPRVRYGSNIKGDIDFRAMGLTCYDATVSGQPPEEWLTNSRIDIGIARADSKRKAIEEAFFVPLFNAVSQLRSDATAEQVRAILGESRELFHPIFSQLCREFLIPVLRRSFAILLRAGAFPPPPPDVVQKDDLGAFIADPNVEFVSAMALALEQSHLANLNDILTTVAPFAAADPSILDPLNWDVIVPSLVRAKGIPDHFLRSPEEIDAMRQARAQAQQAQQMQAAAASIRDLGGADGIQQLGELAPSPQAP